MKKTCYCFSLFLLVFSFNVYAMRSRSRTDPGTVRYPFRNTRRILQSAYQGIWRAKIRTRPEEIASEIAGFKRDIASCKKEIQFYKQKLGQELCNQVDKAHLACEFSSIFFSRREEGTRIQETVDKFFERINHTYPTQCNEQSSKEQLLIAFENSHRKIIEILRKEKAGQATMSFYSSRAKQLEQTLLPQWIEEHMRYSSEKDLLEAIRKLDLVIEKEYCNLCEKESLFNEFKREKIILAALKQEIVVQDERKQEERMNALLDFLSASKTLVMYKSLLQ